MQIKKAQAREKPQLELQRDVALSVAIERVKGDIAVQVALWKVLNNASLLQMYCGV